MSSWPNGSLLANPSQMPISNQGLALLKYMWSTAGAGELHPERSRAECQWAAGQRGKRRDHCGRASPTPVVSFTPTLVDTLTPTTGPIIHSHPHSCSAGLHALKSSASEFFYGDLRVNQVTIQVHGPAPNLSGVLLFLRLKTSPAARRRLGRRSAMTAVRQMEWSRARVNSSSLAGAGSMTAAWLL